MFLNKASISPFMVWPLPTSLALSQAHFLSSNHRAFGPFSSNVLCCLHLVTLPMFPTYPSLLSSNVTSLGKSFKCLIYTHRNLPCQALISESN